jgi:hypothetical protein
VLIEDFFAEGSIESLDVRIDFPVPDTSTVSAPLQDGMISTMPRIPSLSTRAIKAMRR